MMICTYLISCLPDKLLCAKMFTQAMSCYIKQQMVAEKMVLTGYLIVFLLLNIKYSLCHQFLQGILILYIALSDIIYLQNYIY